MRSESDLAVASQNLDGLDCLGVNILDKFGDRFGEYSAVRCRGRGMVFEG